MKKYLPLIICVAMAGSLFAQENNQPPSVRKIPGLTAEDKFPNACIDCHANKPDLNFDSRLSTMLTRWYKEVDQEVLKKAQGTVSEGVTLKGVHPQATEAFKNIPSACISCHKSRPNAPPFAPVIHIIHLTGGEENHFITAFQGDCTNCHKLNVTTGIWTIPSGPEK